MSFHYLSWLLADLTAVVRKIGVGVVGMYVSEAETDLRLPTRGQRAGVKLRVILRSYARLSCTRMSKIVNPRVNLSYVRVTLRECPPWFLGQSISYKICPVVRL